MLMPSTEPALVQLLRTLAERGYRFVTATPATHARVVARSDRQLARDLSDVLGWSLPFAPDLLDDDIRRLLEAGDAIKPAGAGRWRSRYRVSSLGDRLYLHSAYPTQAADSVFFGPDSYRFADLIESELGRVPPRRGAHIVDIGTGAGVGAIVAATRCPDAKVTATDINPKALCLAAINAEAAGVGIERVESGDLTGVDDPIDIAFANPPYIIDDGDRAYRDGGGMHGGQVSLDMARMATARLAPGGRLVLYTGSAIVRGGDPLRDALAELAAQRGLSLSYRELDPDVFGEELESDAYADVDRIAVVAAVLARA
jgi:methylase of polypeptide subunit release factors